jgi:hypothetical protein
MGERLRKTLAAVLAKRGRWLPVALLAVGLFAVNGASRLITWKGGFVKDDQQMRIGFIAVATVAVILIAASAWWSYRYPFGRVVADLGLAVLIAAAAAVIIGPYLGGSRPFKEGLEFVVLQVLLFLGLGAAGVFVGFLGVVAFGADWKSRGLKRYEQNYRARPRRPVRG